MTLINCANCGRAVEPIWDQPGGAARWVHTSTNWSMCYAPSVALIAVPA
jgi:hypothetical protein